MDHSLSQGAVAALILVAITIGMMGQAFVSLLEHNRRKMALEVIKAALEAGKDPPPQLYEQLSKADEGKAPWTEVVLFTALSVGFWIAATQSADEKHMAFMVVAATMTVAALGCLVMAILRSRRGRTSDEGR